MIAILTNSVLQQILVIIMSFPNTTMPEKELVLLHISLKGTS